MEMHGNCFLFLQDSKYIFSTEARGLAGVHKLVLGSIIFLKICVVDPCKIVRVSGSLIMLEVTALCLAHLLVELISLLYMFLIFFISFRFKHVQAIDGKRHFLIRNLACLCWFLLSHHLFSCQMFIFIEHCFIFLILFCSNRSFVSLSSIVLSRFYIFFRFTLRFVCKVVIVCFMFVFLR